MNSNDYMRCFKKFVLFFIPLLKPIFFSLFLNLCTGPLTALAAPHDQTDQAEDHIATTPVKAKATKENLDGYYLSNIADSYVDLMDFQEGDLLYGLEAARAHTRRLLQESLDAIQVVTVDPFNNLLPDPNDFDRPQEIILATPQSLSPRDSQRFSIYFDFLRERKILEPLSDIGNDLNAAPLARKACKLAILHTREIQRRIHFILDFLDMDAVIHKTDLSRALVVERPTKKIKPQPTSESKRVPKLEKDKFFTASELRFLYRMWLKDPSSIEHVLFYKNGYRVEPPWVDNRQQWRQYKPHVMMH
jgi:hypothetical protein